MGSLLPPTENVLYEIEMQMRDQGFTAIEISKALNLRRALQQAIITNSGWEEFSRAAVAAHNERWFNASRTARYAAVPLPPDGATLRRWRNPLQFDPLPYWAEVRCPVLAIYGELDKSTPTKRDTRLLREALQKAGNEDFTITVLRHTDHSFFEILPQREIYLVKIPDGERYIPGYVDGLVGWLSRHLMLAPPLG